MKKQDNQKAIRTLLATISGVGFVTPLTFSNIAEAANYGAGGTEQWLSNEVLNKNSSISTTAATSQWATQTGTDAGNYVVFHGVKFKIVAVEGSGDSARVTLWSYEKDGTKFKDATGADANGKIKYATSSWGDTPERVYAGSNLMKAMDSLYESVFESDSRIQSVGLKYDSATNEKTTDGNDLDKKYVWAPGLVELGYANDGSASGEWQLTNGQRKVVSKYSWLRSPAIGPHNTDAFFVSPNGNVSSVYVGTAYLLRPALQILNQTSWVFTTNVAIPTNGEFTADGSGTPTSYALNSTAAIVPTFTPATDGVTLDGTKIGINATDKSSGTYAMAGLLTTNAGTTWDAINTGDNANIAYMAQVSGGELDLKNVAAGTDYNLKIFGLKTADTAVTQLADNAVQGLSVVGTGDKAKIHMKIGGTVNTGMAVTVSDGAVADLVGDASNPVTVIETGTAQKGKLNIGNNTYSGAITNKSGELAVTADANGGTMTGAVSGNGKLIVESGKLIYTGSSIANDVEIKAGATLDPDAGVFANGKTITNYGTLEITGGTLNATIDGKGGDNLVMKGQMEIGADGKVKQASGSNVTVAASMIEADTNDATKAMFTGVTATGQLNVSAGNLTLTGTVQEGKYYVLVAGDAVGTTLTKDNLWKLDNIKVEGMFNVEYNTNLTGKSIAIQVTNATTYEELNTSGVAAVQQGNMAVSKEFTAEVENHLGMISRPMVREKDKAKIRNVASTNKDDYKVDVVEQGNANEIMPVQVVEKDKYDKEVWASYIRTKETTEGMNLGVGLKGDNTAQYNGYVVGVDFYSSKKAIAGMALSYTTGDIDSFSGTISTRNKSKYYGISFYDRVTNGNTALIYDIGYIRGDNDISQFYTGKETTSDVKTNTYTAGARWEAAIETGRSKIVPFAAFRYMRVNNGDYTNSHGVKFDTKNQNLYIPKVGIAWTGDFIMPKSVWTWRPSVEAGYVWNLGDRTADSNVLMGTRPAAIEYDTVDKSSYYAKAGMEFMHKNFTAGLFYRCLKGDKVRNNKWNVNVSWAF